MNIIKIAEALDTSLLEKQATGDISDYSLDIVHDDDKIEVVVLKNVPIKNIKIKYNLKKAEYGNMRKAERPD